MQVFSFLQDICRDQHERVARHAKLTHERLIDLPCHAAYWSLLSQQIADVSRGFLKLYGLQFRGVHVDN